MAAFEIPKLVGFRSRKFDIRHAQDVTPYGERGFIQTVNRTSPFWTAEYTTPPLVGAKEHEARVFIDALEGSIGTFLAYDPRRIMPYAYRNQSEASEPWGSAPTITNYNYAASTITLGDMALNSIITKGDYVSAQIGGVWYLWRAMQSTTNGSGTSVSFVVKPRPNIISLPTPVPIRYKRACCEMKVIGDAEWEDDVESFSTLRFRAGQFINRAA